MSKDETNQDEAEEYRVNIWYETEVDFDVEAESPEEALEEARERLAAGLGTPMTPTQSDIASEEVVGVIDGNVVRPILE